MHEYLIIRGQWGLGDNIFARPFVKACSEKYITLLETPWPELFEDLNIQFIKGERKLRTQMENVYRQDPSRWVQPPGGARSVRFKYGSFSRSITNSLEIQINSAGVGLDNPVWDLPEFSSSPVKSEKPIAFVRPVTVRSEWTNEARNPLPEYVHWVAAQLMRTHHVVVVASLDENQEWLVGDLPPHHEAFTKGEFNITELMSLVNEADVVVGGVGWIVPASIALKKKAFFILGGNGCHNSPSFITDPRMDLSRVAFAMPERFCRCTKMLHNCDKTIGNLPEQWRNFQELICHPSI